MQPQVNLTTIPNDIQEYLKKMNTTTRVEHRKPNHYGVTDICRCLRRSYYEISQTEPDTSSEAKTIESLWILQSRKFLHNLTYASKWRELDFERQIPIDQKMNRSVSLHGRLDMYEYKSETIVDLKITNAVNWQLENSMIPRLDDIYQIQSYAFLFRDIIKVSKLILLYADLKNLLAFGIPLVDRNAWIKEKTALLHNAIDTRSVPPAEPSTMCNLCPFKQRCDKEGSLVFEQR